MTGLNVEFKILNIWPAVPMLIARTGFEPGAAVPFLTTHRNVAKLRRK